ncbi:MAG: hypothetical protein J6L82_08495 [Alphaproteobacteria bacterium]|nr:hypothetical protein [Alphaproteobacteria bacterium]
MVKTDQSQKFNEQDYIDRLKQREELIKKIEKFLNDEEMKIPDLIEKEIS